MESGFVHQSDIDQVLTGDLDATSEYYGIREVRLQGRNVLPPASLLTQAIPLHFRTVPLGDRSPIFNNLGKWLGYVNY